MIAAFMQPDMPVDWDGGGAAPLLQPGGAAGGAAAGPPEAAGGGAADVQPAGAELPVADCTGGGGGWTGR
jgi:hypothetical protein